MKNIPINKEGENAKPLVISIACNNWPDQFPYSPKAEVSLWHDGDNIFITYTVNEEDVAAVAENDNDKVFKDSCVEFFIAFDDNGYYNIETNCTGRVLMSHRKGRKEDIKYAPPGVLTRIERTPSLGTAPFECKKADGPWTLALKFPTSVFFMHDIKNLSGVVASCNFYKCGDMLPVPHYLSAFPIVTLNPDFHQPSFFEKIKFQ